MKFIVPKHFSYFWRKVLFAYLFGRLAFRIVEEILRPWVFVSGAKIETESRLKRPNYFIY